MGRKIYDEDLRLNLILNGQGLASGSAKMVAELGKMEHEMIALENKAKKLALSIKNLEKNAVANASKLATERAEYAQLTQTIRAHALALEQQRQKVGLLGMTVQQLRNHIKELQIKLFNMSGSQGTPLFQALQRELRETQIRLNTLVTGASRLSQAWSRMEQTINKAGTVVGWFAMAVFGVVRLVGNVITRMKELEDLMGVVRKNTELTVGQVWEMKEAFDQWDTRTKTDDLLKLAIVAGKLGIQGKDDIMKFTEAANMIQVALGDDLDGTVEDTVNSIGKLTNAYRVLTKENKKTGKNFTLDEAMMATGSVLNELAKSSAASAGTILNYMTRLSAVGELAGFTIAQIGGIGSTLDAMNVPAERGATAMQRIMLALANPKKIQEFADALGLTAEGYVDMLKKDPNQAMTRLLHKFVTTKNGLVELTGGLKDFGAKGMYMTAVVGTMAQNLDVLAQQQEVAAAAWDKQQSVLDEYNIMNNNFTANVLKQQKVIRAQTDHMNREAEPAVLRLVTLWASFVVGIRNATDWIAKHWTAIKTMTFAYLLLKTPAIWRISNLILESVWTKANLLLMRARIVWMQAEILWTRNLTGAQIVLMNQSKFLTIAHIALTQGIGPAIAAIRALAVSMYALPGVAVVATIAALAGAFYMLVVRKNDLTEAEKRHLALQKEVQDDFFTEKANLTVMMDRLKNANISQEERLMLIKKINSEYGEYLPKLIDEGASAEDLAKSYDLVVEALARKITYEKTSKAGADIKIEMDRTKEKIKLAKEELDAYKLTKSAQMAMMNPEANVPAMYAMDQMGTKIKKLEKSYADYAAEYTRLQSEFTAVAPRKQTIEIDNKIVDFPTEESFKDSQEALKRNFEQTELLIKQNALKTKATDEQLNENLRNAKIKYLRAQLQDMADKYRTEGEFEANYRSAQVALTDELLAQQKEGRKEGDKDEKKDAKGRIKDVKEFGEELINVEKLRISAIADEREKAVAEENLRHEQEIGKYWQNDEAIEYEETAHLQNMADINLKYLDKQLADKAVDFAQKKNLLELYHNNERISEEQYQTTKAALEKQEAEAMVEYKKQAGLYSADQLAALEIAELKKSEQFKALTVEEQERLIDNIKVKHGRIRAKNLKKTLDDELNDIKESMTEEQLILLEEGQKKIDIAQKVGQSMGEMFVSMFDKSQDAAAVFAKGMLKMAIEETRAFVRLQYVKLMARNVAHMGPAGVAVSLVEIGLIEAAFAVAEGLVGKINTSKEKTATAPQNAEGRYPVIGKDDGRLYQAAYGGRPVTGVYTGPTLLNMANGQSLVGERAPELVVDGDTFRRIQVNAPQLLRDIYAYAGKGRYMENRNTTGTGQRAEGSYPELSGTTSQQSDSGKGSNQEQRMISAIEKLNAHLDKGIPAYVNKYGHNGLQEAIGDIGRFDKLTK